MCCSLYRCASAHYRIKLDWLICRSCTFQSSELAELCFSLCWDRSTSGTALPCTQRCLCSHLTAQHKPRRVLGTTALASRLRTFFPFPLFKYHRFLFALLSEKMHNVQRDADAEHLSEVVILTQTVTARLNRQQWLCVPCSPWYPHPSFQPPFLRHVCHTPEL